MDTGCSGRAQICPQGSHCHNNECVLHTDADGDGDGDIDGPPDADGQSDGDIDGPIDADGRDAQDGDLDGDLDAGPDVAVDSDVGCDLFTGAGCGTERRCAWVSVPDGVGFGPRCIPVSHDPVSPPDLCVWITDAHGTHDNCTAGTVCLRIGDSANRCNQLCEPGREELCDDPNTGDPGLCMLELPPSFEGARLGCAPTAPCDPRCVGSCPGVFSCFAIWDHRAAANVCLPSGQGEHGAECDDTLNCATGHHCFHGGCRKYCSLLPENQCAPGATYRCGDLPGTSCQDPGSGFPAELFSFGDMGLCLTSDDLESR